MIHTLRKLLQEILAARGLDLTTSGIQQIEQCLDIGRLCRLCMRASTATLTSELDLLVD